MKKTAQNGNIGIILVILLLVSLGIYLISNPKNQLSKITNTSLKDVVNKQNSTPESFVSNNLDFSVEIPHGFNTYSDPTFIDLNKDNMHIKISRIATNFSDIKKYLEDFDSKRSIDIQNEKPITINDLPSIKRTELFKGGPISTQTVFYILANTWVYSISTSSESLYPDLDQIAQSFHYTP